MLPSDLTHPVYTDADMAREFLEAMRWPDGVACPHCGVIGESTKLAGKKHRAGLYQCQVCRKQFSVTVGTLYERSHIPLHKWLLATHLLCASKKGVSAHQLWRMLGFGSYRTAWFMAHRIREGMRPATNQGQIGGEGQVVEADETYYGNKKVDRRGGIGAKGRPFTKSGKAGNKRAIVALVERGGKVRSFHVERADKTTVAQVVMDNIASESRLHTDESRLYKDADDYLARHETVNHTAGEYVRDGVTTNSVEGYFSIFKRGMTGVYQHCGEQHLHRYLAEFDFRYCERIALGVDDAMRTYKALQGIEGKRLTYHATVGKTVTLP